MLQQQNNKKENTFIMHVISAGHTRHLGPTIERDGVNFCIWSPDAESVELLLFKNDHDDDPEIILLESDIFRSNYYWHVKVLDLKAGQIFAWRIHQSRAQGCDDPLVKNAVLIDPYAKRVVYPEGFTRYQTLQNEKLNFKTCAKSAVIDIDDYDWGMDIRPGTSMRKSVIYEMHVKGFTASPSSGLGEQIRGTYRGLIEKIPYLVELGITAVELLPVYQFDERDAKPGHPNYWGYSPVSFFAPHEQYSSDKSLNGPLNEFRDMVKALHRNNIEVILDVVYNHTSEGDEHGPCYCFKGFDKQGYYILNEEGRFTNYTGCGNTFNGNSPVVRALILDSLTFWKDKMHVDGFRFDLAAILSRDQQGTPLTSSPTLLDIDTNHHLADTKLIAEPWDAGGLYALGKISGSRWREWNGRFRDDVRSFMRGDCGLVNTFINRLLGSPDIYNEHKVDSQKSLNFITCHDGFTLWDLVSYTQKRNEANGENSRDGCDCNYSANYGIEGETEDSEVNALRLRQCKNFMILTLMSFGVPMLLMGDEVLRTQRGNNNAYCQDNELSYFDWNALHNERSQEMLNFTKVAIRMRRMAFAGHMRYASHGTLMLNKLLRNSSLQWHGVKPFQPDWSEQSHSVGMIRYSTTSGYYIYFFINAWWNDLVIELPPCPAGAKTPWFKALDTSCPATQLPSVFNVSDFKRSHAGDLLRVKARSVVMFVSPNI